MSQLGATELQLLTKDSVPISRERLEIRKFYNSFRSFRFPILTSCRFPILTHQSSLQSSLQISKVENVTRSKHPVPTINLRDSASGQPGARTTKAIVASSRKEHGKDLAA